MSYLVEMKEEEVFDNLISQFVGISYFHNKLKLTQIKFIILQIQKN